MATRPIFVPTPDAHPYVSTLNVEFEWHAGFAKSQAQKSIASLHQAAARRGIDPILEISSKSPSRLGIQLSAFNLILNLEGRTFSVESAFQGSKVFERGGPYQDLYDTSSRDAKKDPRIVESGRLIGFRLFEQEFPTQPVTAFYDWLYLTALVQNPGLAGEIRHYKGFSDIAFNPERSLNCQARSAALYVALSGTHNLEMLLANPERYLALVNGKSSAAPLDEKNAGSQMRMPW